MNDIKLIQDEIGFYDWSFGVDDIDNVIGIQQTASSIKAAILIKFDELNLYLYRNIGSEIEDLLKLNMNDNTKKIIEETVGIMCKQVTGVTSANVTVIEDSPSSLSLRISVILENGEEIFISGI